MTDPKDPPGLAPVSIVRKISEIASELDPIRKENQAPAAAGGFRYAGIDQLIAKIGPLMDSRGVIMFPTRVEPAGLETPATSASAREKGWHVSYLITWVFSDGTSSIEVTVPGEGSDSSDKASNKAVQASRKYALLTTFFIEVDDDNDGSAPAQSSGGQAQSSVGGSGSSFKPPSPPQLKFAADIVLGQVERDGFMEAIAAKIDADQWMSRKKSDIGKAMRAGDLSTVDGRDLSKILDWSKAFSEGYEALETEGELPQPPPDEKPPSEDGDDYPFDFKQIRGFWV